MTQGPAKSRSLRLWLAMSCTAIATAMGFLRWPQKPSKSELLRHFRVRSLNMANQFKESVEVYVAQNGSEINGNKIELIYRDEGGANPAAAKSLAQELIVKDGSNISAASSSHPMRLLSRRSFRKLKFRR